MPIYEYLCANCGYQFEEVQKFNDPPVEECPNCGKKSASRQISMSAFHLKGGGWYKDGYSGKSNESEKTEKSVKEIKADSENKSSAKDKKSTPEKSHTTSNKESNTSKKSESTGKEKAA
ncbi:MAG: transcriptional regulator [Deltaproteobacteria bacterium]|nr:transcriptional regulator [Deltaproteobacteria bacterium]